MGTRPGRVARLMPRQTFSAAFIRALGGGMGPRPLSAQHPLRDLSRRSGQLRRGRRGPARCGGARGLGARQEGDAIRRAIHLRAPGPAADRAARNLQRNFVTPLRPSPPGRYRTRHVVPALLRAQPLSRGDGGPGRGNHPRLLAAPVLLRSRACRVGAPVPRRSAGVLVRAGDARGLGPPDGPAVLGAHQRVGGHHRALRDRLEDRQPVELGALAAHGSSP